MVMRKTFISLFVVLATLMGLLGGCRHEVKPVDISFDSIKIERSEHLVPDDTLSPSCMLSIDLKYAAPDDSVTQRINEAIVRMAFEYEGVAPRAAADSFATAYVKRYHQELMPYYMEEQQKGEVGAWYNYVYELTTSLVSAQDSVWGYRFERVTYEGGAHGNHTINYVNFDKASGQQIALDDVFVADYEEPLTRVLLSALQEFYGMESLDELHDAGFLTWTEMYPSKNFLLGTDGMHFYYNAYEIAPYAFGPTELIIPYESLTDLMKH